MTATVRPEWAGPGAGEVVTLAPKVPTGEAPCPGEAHSNAFIDHCGLCAPRWGVVTTYAAPTLADVTNGFAVPCGRVDRGPDRAAFEAAEEAGEIRRVGVDTKNNSFFVWVAWCTAHSDCRETPALGKACLEAQRMAGGGPGAEPPRKKDR